MLGKITLRKELGNFVMMQLFLSRNERGNSCENGEHRTSSVSPQNHWNYSNKRNIYRGSLREVWVAFCFLSYTAFQKITWPDQSHIGRLWLSHHPKMKGLSSPLEGIIAEAERSAPEQAEGDEEPNQLGTVHVLQNNHLTNGTVKTKLGNRERGKECLFSASSHAIDGLGNL